MLDGVNEYFVTRNSLLSAEVDLRKAEQRAAAAIGILLTKVGVAGERADTQAAYELALLERGAGSTYSTCPSELPDQSVIDIAQIYEQTDAEFEAQKQPMFEGEGGFGTFEGDGGAAPSKEKGGSEPSKARGDSVTLIHPRMLILSFLSQS